MSSGGAAVGFPGANADSTGVIAGGGDGSIVGTRVVVGTAAGVAAQEFKMSKKGTRAKWSFFMREPQ